MAGLLITGASGYLGRELARRCPGAAGTYLEREPPGQLAPAAQLDVRDAEAVTALIEQLRPEAIIHTVYRQGGHDAEEVNVAGSRAVARAAAESGARLVHLSTDLVFDGALGRPYHEGDEPRPVMEYGRQKLRAEMAVGEEHPEALIVRTSLIYGGAEPSPHEQLAVAAARGGKDVGFFTDELRSPVQVADLAGALLELVESNVAGPLHVAGADGVNRYEFARRAVVAQGEDDDALRSGLAADHPAPRPLDCRLDSSKAQAMLRTRLRGVREVLAG